MVASEARRSLDVDFLAALLVIRLPHLAEDADIVEFITRDVLLPEGVSAWETPDSLYNVLNDHFLDFSLSSTELESQLLCEDLQQLYQTPDAQTMRLCTLLKQGSTLQQAYVSSTSPEAEEQVAPGTCVMCERHMPLTWHHLYPREVQKKLLKRGMMTEEDRCRGISICRQCHNTIHRSFDNELLAERLHSVESLLQEECIQKWVAYASKQKARAVVGHRVSR